jgi:hypothetical protein
MDYSRHVSRQPTPDIWELSHTPRQIAPYEPRPGDVVPFEADERVQHVVLEGDSTNSAGTCLQSPAGGNVPFRPAGIANGRRRLTQAGSAYPASRRGDAAPAHLSSASPSAGMQAPDGGHREGQGVAAKSDSAGRSVQAESYE